MISSNLVPSNKTMSQSLFNACQLGKHVFLPFFSSNKIVHAPFDIMHSDIWTSPITILGGLKY